MRLVFVSLSFCIMASVLKAQQIQPLPYENIVVAGELHTRAHKNFDRLESDIYTPSKVFPEKHESISADWPGDYEGRIILALTLQARATQRTPKYLEELISLIPKKVNAKGYLGRIMQDSILEQQLSGHGWFLRALCEYYAWKKDPAVKKYISDIVLNLALPTRGFHKIYPIDPGQRNKETGAAIGTTQASIGRWKLSSDIGCDFIFMDGVIQAYSVIPSPELKALIDEMVARFLEVDLAGISAQTHATLTGIRALLRYYELTGKPSLLKNAESRYLMYRKSAMTENFENYNWFGRPEWTEPCAIIDAYIVVNQLWMHTKKALYMEDAHLIYYNAIAHTQRHNGGFGLDNCTNHSTHLLQVKANEAYWCCTMRGGEGLAKAVQYNYFTAGNTIYVPAFSNSTASFTITGEKVVLQQTTGYPFYGKMTLVVREGATNTIGDLAIFIPAWATKIELLVNGKAATFRRQNQFAILRTSFSKGTTIQYSFEMQVKELPLVNNAGTQDRRLLKFQYGPLLLGYASSRQITLQRKPVFTRAGNDKWESKDKQLTLTPVYHLLSPEVSEESGYSKQVIFLLNSK